MYSDDAKGILCGPLDGNKKPWGYWFTELRYLPANTKTLSCPSLRSVPTKSYIAWGTYGMTHYRVAVSSSYYNKNKDRLGEFVVDTNGTVTSLKMKQPSGTMAFADVRVADSTTSTTTTPLIGCGWSRLDLTYLDGSGCAWALNHTATGNSVFYDGHVNGKTLSQARTFGIMNFVTNSGGLISY